MYRVVLAVVLYVEIVSSERVNVYSLAIQSRQRYDESRSFKGESICVFSIPFNS